MKNRTTTVARRESAPALLACGVIPWRLLVLGLLTSGCSSGGGSSTTVACYAESGAEQGCSFTRSNAADFSCVAPEQVGSCPSAGLVGCCVTTTLLSGITTTAGSCLYDPSLAGPARMACSGPGAAWTSTGDAGPIAALDSGKGDAATGTIPEACYVSSGAGAVTHCVSDTDCLGGARCDTAISPPACIALYCLPQGAPCSDVVDCTQGMQCHDGQCNPCNLCGSLCEVDFTSDPTNCGVCGKSVGTGQECQNGTVVCAPATPVACGSACVDTGTDAANCGACGKACATGATCQAGNCGCPGGEAVCDGACVDEQLDPDNCGACGKTCPDSMLCASGSCGCPSGDDVCAGTCVDEQTDADNCGACGVACASGASCHGGTCACASGESLCSDTCVNEQTDGDNCGGCGVGCGGTCKLGRCVVTLASEQGEVENIAVDATSVYWTAGEGGGSVVKVPVDGGTPTTLAVAQGPEGIAVNATTVYWVVQGDEVTDVGGGVFSVPLNGGATTRVASSQTPGGALALSATGVYWSLLVMGIETVALSGGTPTSLTPAAEVVDLALEGTDLYWIDRDSQAVMKTPAAGGASTVFAQGTYPFALRADAANVYWTDEASAGTGEVILKAALGGGAPVTLAVDASIFALAVDASSVYWVNHDYVMKAPLSGGAPTTLASDFDQGSGIAVDATSVYWTDPIASTVMKVTPK